MPFDLDKLRGDELFGIQCLPYGIFHPSDGSPARIGARLGDHVLDLFGMFGDACLSASSLNSLMEQGRGTWNELRGRIIESLEAPRFRDLVARNAHSLDDVDLGMPFEVADYVDFFASEHHAVNVARLFRPGVPPLHANWKSLPVGYHGRAGTVYPSGVPVKRPWGQSASEGDKAIYGPSRKLDFELEVGFVVGRTSPIGQPVTVDEFDDYVFGVNLVCDWSARDLQAWETFPLGPFTGKSFCTSISHWVVPLAALEGARRPLVPQDPLPSSYLRGKVPPWGLDLALEAAINGDSITKPNFRDMYWSPAQMLAHMTVNGARTRAGDLFASGTVSGPQEDQLGCLMEITKNGNHPITLGNGESRAYLEDGDETIFTGRALLSDGSMVGLGEVRAIVA
jgi:fumarylacetoacetase